MRLHLGQKTRRLCKFILTKFFKGDDLFEKYNIKVKPETKQLVKRPPELQTQIQSGTKLKDEDNMSKQTCHQLEVTPSLHIGSLMAGSKASVSPRLDVAGPFSLFDRASQKPRHDVTVQPAFLVPPSVVHTAKTKKENADTALTVTEKPLRDSRSGKVKELVRFIDEVLRQVSSDPRKSRSP